MPTSDRAPQPASIHQLKITLRGLKPPIWRRVAVPSDMTLGDLHHLIQIAMGWQDSHLHEFQIGKETYGDPEMLEESGDRDEWEAKLSLVALKARKTFRYLYDFGDHWEHEILVEAVGAPEPGIRYPTILAGEHACPPDDSGGVWGYADLLEILADPDNPNHEEMMMWAGGPIDPEAFDLKKVNKLLHASPKRMRI
jgi:hypothetical protein